MRFRRDGRTPDDLQETEARLRRERPAADPETLDRVHASVADSLDRVPGRHQPPRRTRVAIAGLLAAGVLMSGTGGALAITGTSGSGSAGAAQYLAPTTQTTPTTQQQTTPPTGDVLGESATDAVTPPTTPEDETEPTPIGEPDSVTEAGVIREAEGSRQVEAGARTRELPFTGLAAIPIILAGLVLMSAGLVLRRTSARTSRQGRVR